MFLKTEIKEKLIFTYYYDAMCPYFIRAKLFNMLTYSTVKLRHKQENEQTIPQGAFTLVVGCIYFLLIEIASALI